jgi:hypothetical protein
MVDQPTAEDRLIDRRSVLRAGAALAVAGPALLRGAHAKAQPRAAVPTPRRLKKRPAGDRNCAVGFVGTPVRIGPDHFAGRRVDAVQPVRGIDPFATN